MTFRSDVEKDLREELVETLLECEEIEFHTEHCELCDRLLDRIVEISLRFSGFDTKDLREKAEELQLGKVRD